MDERSIWNERQNVPELVVRDMVAEFNLDEEQAEKVRFILLRRGVNKWLWARRLFIKFKHETKAQLTELYKQKGKKAEKRILQKFHARLQNICRMPRWVIWPKHVKNWKNIERDIIIKGKHC